MKSVLPVGRIIHKGKFIDWRCVEEALLNLIETFRPSVKAARSEKAESTSAQGNVSFGHRKNRFVVLRDLARSVDVPRTYGILCLFKAYWMHTFYLDWGYLRLLVNYVNGSLGFKKIWPWGTIIDFLIRSFKRCFSGFTACYHVMLPWMIGLVVTEKIRYVLHQIIPVSWSFVLKSSLFVLINSIYLK